ncbi:MAG: PQQ-dependent sugar dehydrogenase [Flavobacteriaceae bacterium]|nr:PQQ-dependent sugar dehydrogenase [Flavobacteriaceae bacterium]
MNKFLLFLVVLVISCTGNDDNSTVIVNPPDGNDDNLPIVPQIDVPEGFVVEAFASNLNLPTNIAFPPDGSNRLFVNELQSGQIKIIENGTLLSTPFADLETMVTGGFPVDGENGLIGLAFDPNYEINKWVYVTLAVRTPNGTVGRVLRMRDQNNRAQDVEILIDNLPSANGHQIESLVFGSDEKLYVSVGDAFEYAKAQDLSEFHGKILRMNPDGSIPNDNPDPNSFVWASGLRNSFGLAFNDDGQLFATENGPNEKDELNLIERGGNYGWPFALGNVSNPEFQNPVHVWENIVAPTALHFYTGNQFPQKYRNQMFVVLFGRTASQGPDPISKRIQLLTTLGTGEQLTVSFEDFAVYRFPGGGNPIGITQGPEGSLYISDIFQGKIFRIRFQS